MTTLIQYVTILCARRRDDPTTEFVFGLTLSSPSQLPVALGLPWKTTSPLHKDVWNAMSWTHALLLLHPLLPRQVIRTLTGWRHFASVNRVNTDPLPCKETGDRDCLFQKEVGKKKNQNTTHKHPEGEFSAP